MIVADMKQAGFLIPHVTKDAEGEAIEHDFEPRTIQTPFGDRGGVVIEPWLTDQWYVDAEKLAQDPIKAVRDGRIEIVPKSWEKTFFNWMENIQPGASAASCGGATGYRPGTMPMARFMSPKTKLPHRHLQAKALR